MSNFDSLIAHCNYDNFNDIALTMFQYQAKYCTVFKEYLSLCNVKSQEINTLEDIVYLPISFFKSHEIKSVEQQAKGQFLSSGTGGNRSRHLIFDDKAYEQSLITHFNRRFNNFHDYCHLALVPNYQEQGSSSLVYQINYFVNQSKRGKGAFYLNDLEGLKARLISHKEQKTPTILWGVTYALLDFADDFSLEFEELIIIETGGMKGRKKEMIRYDVHMNLLHSFPKSTISSEYGMTELFSQAYWNPLEKLFQTHPTMRVSIRDVTDPYTILPQGKHGAINVIDLHNWQTCCFIETADLGIQRKNGFEVLGRLDDAEIRGCSLLYV